jgi:4-hydroxy-3-methylbut-2-enyl diphosphate reductase IspH
MKQALQLPPSVEAKLAKTTVTSGAATPATTVRTVLGEIKPLRVNSKHGTDKAVSDNKDEHLYVILFV